MQQRILDALWRALRTFLEAFLAVYVVALPDADSLSDLVAGPLLTASVIAGVAALGAFLLNALQRPDSRLPLPRG